MPWWLQHLHKILLASQSREAQTSVISSPGTRFIMIQSGCRLIIARGISRNYLRYGDRCFRFKKLDCSNHAQSLKSWNEGRRLMSRAWKTTLSDIQWHLACWMRPQTENWRPFERFHPVIASDGDRRFLWQCRWTFHGPARS